MRTVVITGASGFIGQALIEEFLTEDMRVAAIVRDETKLSDEIRNHKNTEIYECPLDRLASLWDELADEDIAAFYHLAWGGNAGPARADLGVQTENIKDALAAFKFADTLHCDKFIASGTVSEFLIPMQTEKRIYPPTMKYTLAKDFAKQLLRIEAVESKMKFIWCRLANTFGEGNNTGNILDYAIKAFVNGEAPQFSSAAQPYDFLYIRDTAYALSLLAVNELTDDEYFIGSGSSRLLRDYLTETRDIIAPNSPDGIGTRAEDGLTYNKEWFDISALKKDTGFTPRYTFAEGVSRTAAYLREQK